MIKEVKVFAPATVANVGCGFDILGFALEFPGDYVTVRKIPEKKVIIKRIFGDGGKLPLDPRKNTAGIAVNEYIKHNNVQNGFELEIRKGMNIGSGLGSSAASAAAALFAVNYLYENRVEIKQLLACGIKAEAAACGSPHADNIAPSLMGGFILIRSYNPLEVISLDYPEDLYCTIVYPKIELQTRKLRKVLPAEIPLQTAVQQWGNIAGLIAGLYKKDYALISGSLEDFVVEPARSPFIPLFKEVKSRALTTGALGCSLSGSGPSVFALCRGKETADRVAESMRKVYENNSISCKCYVSSINKEGPKVM